MNQIGIVLILFSLLFQAGCAPAVIGGAAAGAGTYVYYQGNLKTRELASLNETWFAVVRTMEEIDAEIISREKDEVSANLVAKNVFGKKIRINLRYEKLELTDLTIRHGFFGDERESKEILNKIQEKLY